MNDEKQQKTVYKDNKTQEMLNKPAAYSGGLKGEDKNFLEMVVELIKDGVIDPLKPDSIINHEVYDKLSEEAQGKVDLEAVNLTSALREIQALYESGNTETFQIQNMIDRVKNTKERLEEEGGDLFVI